MDTAPPSWPGAAPQAVPTYEQDFHAWTQTQATLLRTGRATEADLHNIAEEIESLGRAERNELVNRLAVLLLHFLKWIHQPERRKSWRLTIEEQRRKLARHLRENPSLRSFVEQATADAHGDALLLAERETDLPRQTFPTACPYTLDQLLDPAFHPGPA